MFKSFVSNVFHMPKLPASMKVAFVRETGPAANIQIGRWPVPECGPADVLIKASALAVNHVDLFVRSGAYRTPLPMPFVIGRDCVGQVASTGSGVEGFSVGDFVWCNSLGHEGRQGSFSEYVQAPADRVYPLPAGVDPQRAVAVLHTGAAAWLGLVREGRLQGGDTVFIAGAAGGVGGAAVQMARAIGARVLATASAEDAHWVASLGAEHVLDYRDPDLTARLLDLAAGRVDIYWDQSGRHDFNQALQMLAPGGRVIVSAGLDATPALPIGELYTRDASLRGFALSNASKKDLARAARTINAHLESGRLEVRIAKTLPLDEAAQAHRLLEAGSLSKLRGRVVVLP